jgi:hypothetical protein
MEGGSVVGGDWRRSCDGGPEEACCWLGEGTLKDPRAKSDGDVLLCLVLVLLVRSFACWRAASSYVLCLFWGRYATE